MVKDAFATWACRSFLSPAQEKWTASLTMAGVLTHWSRIFEYPWIMANGNFQKEHVVLDAAGGDSPLQIYVANLVRQIINVDINPSYRPAILKPNVLYATGDIRRLTIADEMFDRVILSSVLEHDPDPEKMLLECMRVLKPGGRLIGSFDVAEYSRYNHNIDINKAATILSYMGLSLPDKPPHMMEYIFPELDPVEGEPTTVALCVLCFWWDKK